MMQDFSGGRARSESPVFAQPQGPMHAGPRPGAGWQNEFSSFAHEGQQKQQQQQQQHGQSQQASGWRQDFMEGQHQPMQEQGFHQQQGYGMGMNMGMGYRGSMSMMGGMPMQMQPVPMQQPTQKGKEKLVELSSENWEEQFKALDMQPEEQTEEQKEPEEDFRDFESIWKEMQEENPALAEEWANEFEQPLDASGKPNLGEYMFEPNNPYMQHANPFEEGMRLLTNGSGSLSEAALCFEAVCQREEGEQQQRAWSQLGLCQAQNEKEDAAIKALENAIRLDPGDLAALMGLAVSYTNDGYDTAAYLSLEQWLVAKYPNLVSDITMDTSNRKEVHQKVTAQFIKAAQLSPTGAEMDADVQVGLGVLFYGDEEYDKAVDCFSAALRIRPDDALLWNRLGATLANSGKSEDAIEAYTRALEISPTFVRCRYNLGVSCINIGVYEEAAQHLLSGLAMHQTMGDRGGGVNLSTNLWETLRRVFLVGMNRPDLSKLAVSGADVEQFRSEFEF
jgi:peroxin-5